MKDNRLIKGILLILAAVFIGLAADHYGIKHPTQMFTERSECDH